MLTAVVVLGAGAIVATFLLTRPQEVAVTPSRDYVGQPALGDAEAPVKLILFENFMCEHCRAFETEVFPALERDFIDTGRVQALYVNLAWGEEPAGLAGLASECAYRQSSAAFWPYKTRLFERQGDWNTASDLAALADGIADLDRGALETCVRQGQTQGEVDSDLSVAERVGVSGTPSVVIGDQGFEAPDYDTLRMAIEAEEAD